MKRTILALTILTSASSAFAAIDCATLPSCASLGYSESAGSCKGKYLTCPFDSSKIACLDSPAVGDLKYSLKSSNHNGWVLCDGTQYSTTTYSKLYNVIGANFCRKYSSKTGYTSSACSSGKFAVPDYRGFFLRGINNYNATSNTVGAPSSYYGYAFYYMTGNYNTSTSSPQYEQLPNISGSFRLPGTEGYHPSGNPINSSYEYYSGAFSKGAMGGGYAFGHNDKAYNPTVNFTASSSNSIYGGTHVIPASYGAYIFIYAGQ